MVSIRKLFGNDQKKIKKELDKQVKLERKLSLINRKKRTKELQNIFKEKRKAIKAEKKQERIKKEKEFRMKFQKFKESNFEIKRRTKKLISRIRSGPDND